VRWWLADGTRSGQDEAAKYSVGVADQKPPRLASSEAEALRALLQYQRESLVRKVGDLDDAAARWSPVGTSSVS